MFWLIATAILKNSSRLRAEQHPYHLVNSSPWPIFTAITLLNSIIYLIGCLHESIRYGCPFIQSIHFYAILGLFLGISSWFNDIILEATFEGRHTKRVQNGLYLGIALFIVSEIFFFFGFFWAFFHSSISPSIFIGNIWPPLGIETLSTWLLPFLNTVILISSGVSVTWAHQIIVTVFKKKKYKNFKKILSAIFFTIFYGCLFTYIQRFEYINAGFSFNDGIYGTVFFSTTGLHGLHVLVGTIFLIVCTIRIIYHHFTRSHHIGFEIAIWYWHFVDIVWLFLFISIYWWGNSK